jgi:hypothetical protein
MTDNPYALSVAEQSEQRMVAGDSSSGPIYAEEMSGDADGWLTALGRV